MLRRKAMIADRQYRPREVSPAGRLRHGTGTPFGHGLTNVPLTAEKRPLELVKITDADLPRKQVTALYIVTINIAADDQQLTHSPPP